MSLTTILMALMRKEDAGGGDPPSAAPTDVGLFNYSGDLVGVQWSNGDSTASTEIGFGTLSTEPSSVEATAGPGVTSYESGRTGTVGTSATGTYAYCRHKKNGQVTAWVRSSNSYT